VAFSPDGKRIATASTDHTAKVWDAETGKELHTLRGQDGWVRTVAFSPDGKWVATGGGRDNEARLWDAETGKHVHTLVGHSSWVHWVAFSPDSKRVVTASQDKSAKVWNIPEMGK
jgi:WD40 repeat protein